MLRRSVAAEDEYCMLPDEAGQEEHEQWQINIYFREATGRLYEPYPIEFLHEAKRFEVLFGKNQLKLGIAAGKGITEEPDYP